MQDKVRMSNVETDEMPTTAPFHLKAVPGIDESAVMKMNMTKYSLAADYYAKIAPGTSRLYIRELQKLAGISGLKDLKNKDVCSHCGQLFRPGNHTRSLKPRMKLTKKIRQLQNKSCSKALGKFQEKLLKAYTDGYNYVLIRCLCCEKVTKCKGYRRLHQPKINTQPLDLPVPDKLSKNQNFKKNKKGRRKPGVKTESTSPQMSKSSSSIDDNTSKTVHSKLSRSLPTELSTSIHIVNPPKKTPTMKDHIKRSKSSRKNAKNAFSKLQQMLSKDETSKKQDGSLANFLSHL